MKVRGFTLIELMITVTLVAIVLTIAVPSFQNMVQNNRSVTVANNLKASMQFARSEALKRGVSVSICPQASNYTACGSDWSGGWLIFTNPDANGVFANNADEEIIRTYPASNASLNVTLNPTGSVVTFNPRGFAATGTAGLTITIYTTGCVGPSQRVLSILSTGRVDMTSADCP